MRAKKSLGQNFLTGTHYPERIVAAVRPQPGEAIVEIGPGHGAITGLLVDSGAEVIAIELDRDLVPLLTNRFSAQPNFRLIEADALTVNFCELITPATSVRVVANLPYYISTPILQRLIDHRACLTEMTLMLQREVVERITAKPGGKEYGYISALVQFYCEAQKLFDVPPGAFRPAPKIWSSVMRLTVRTQPPAEVGDEAYFRELLSALFAQRRKTILNNLKASRTKLQIADEAQITRALNNAELDAMRRAETLELAEMAHLSRALLSEIAEKK